MAALNINQSSLTSFDGTVAGHDGVLTDQSGDLIVKPCTAAETAFYQSALQHHGDFASLMPTYMGNLGLASKEEREAIKKQDPMSINAALQAQEGTAEQLIEKKEGGSAQDPTKVSGAEVPTDSVHGHKIKTNEAIILQNVAAGFVKPNTLDAKLGSRLWGDEANQAKRDTLDKVAAETTSGSLGFRVAGMRVWEPKEGSRSDEAEGEYKVYDKHYGRLLKDSNVQEGFETFFLGAQNAGSRLSPLRRAVLECCEAEVARIEQVLQKEESRMYSASVLFVFEGDTKALEAAVAKIEQMQGKAQDQKATEAGESSDEEEELPKMFVVKLIDFAHAHWTPGEGPDENVLRGLRSMRKILQDILRQK
ncbi:MAG: hypothetical protein M1831_001723 [Alyxoria varia]|nr:MAG: hypothetical protein M1831_001723 [Alyxoria varia]